jgi:arsenate reductase
MATVTIFHNPRCSKSRQALALLEEHGVAPEVVKYLETPPSPDVLRALLAKLGTPAHSLLRVKEAAYAEAGLSRDSSEDACIDAMHRYPILIERPIVVNGDRAVIGRPPELVLDLI